MAIFFFAGRERGRIRGMSPAGAARWDFRRAAAGAEEGAAEIPQPRHWRAEKRPGNGKSGKVARSDTRRSQELGFRAAGGGSRYYLRRILSFSPNDRWGGLEPYISAILGGKSDNHNTVGVCRPYFERRSRNLFENGNGI